MSPLTLRNFAGQCNFESPDWIREAIASRRSFSRSYVNAMNLDSYTRSDSRRFIRLIDGGVSDNLGVRGPFESTLLKRAPHDAKPESLGELRHMVFVLVNAATAPEVTREALDEAPALFDIIDQTTTVQINRYTIELLRSTFESWQEVAARWLEPVGFHLIEALAREAEEQPLEGAIISASNRGQHRRPSPLAARHPTCQNPPRSFYEIGFRGLRTD